jgi:hypothetical protein
MSLSAMMAAMTTSHPASAAACSVVAAEPTITAAVASNIALAVPILILKLRAISGIADTV